MTLEREDTNSFCLAKKNYNSDDLEIFPSPVIKMMQTLPRAILCQILANVDLSTLLDVICTCKKMVRLVNDDLLWYCKVQHEFPNTKPETTWKKLYYKLAFDSLRLFHQGDTSRHIASGVKKICFDNSPNESSYYVIDMFDRLWKYNTDYVVRSYLIDIHVHDFHNGLLMQTNGNLYKYFSGQTKQLIAQNVISMASDGGHKYYIDNDFHLFKIESNLEVTLVTVNVKKAHLFNVFKWICVILYYIG